MNKLIAVIMFTMLAMLAVLPHVQASEHVLTESTDVSENTFQISANHPTSTIDEYSGVADNFTTDSDQWQITLLSLNLARIGTCDGFLAARFYLPDGAKPNETAIVAESTPVAASTISVLESVGEWVNFTFAGPILDANTEYFWGVIALNGTWVLNSKQINVYGTSVTDNPHGWSYEYIGEVSDWYDYESFKNGYIIYGDVVAEAEPATWHDLNSVVVTIAKVVLPILYLVGSALWFVRTEKKPDAQEIIVLAVGLLIIAVVFPLGMNALLA